MSTKSVLAAHRRWREAFDRLEMLSEAQARTDFKSAYWYSLQKLIEQQIKIVDSCTAATNEAGSMHYNTVGDFCHLAAVGSVRFRRGANA